MIRRAVDSDVPAENASRFQQPLGIPFGYPTVSTAPTTTGYSWCPLFPAGPKSSPSVPPCLCGESRSCQFTSGSGRPGDHGTLACSILASNAGRSTSSNCLNLGRIAANSISAISNARRWVAVGP
jgi:hypothetical protein